MFQAVKRPVEIVKRWLDFKTIFLGGPKREKLHIVYVEHTRVCLNLEQINTLVPQVFDFFFDSWGPLEIVKG